MSEFPSSKFERGKIFAKAGLKAGGNYATHYLKRLGNGSADRSETHSKTAKDVLGEFTKLRGTALKIAQSFSVDQGFLPDEFTEVMTQAQYSVPPINRSLVRSLIRSELGAYPEMIFDDFDPEAIAAASIGQVHRATLKDGRKVAVKVQYPGVRDTISSDLALARTIFRRLVSDADELDVYFEEVRKTLIDETDYEIEGASINRFHKRFSSDTVVTPEWVEEFSTKRVLTMTFIEGVHLNEFLKTDPDQEEKNHYGQLMWDFFHRQIRNPEDIHADTHPGNFLFTPDGKLGVIDFGCVKSFPEEFFMDYLRLLPTHLQRDEKAIKVLYFRLGVLKGDPDKVKKEKEYYDFCLNYGYTFAMPYLEDRFDFGDPEYRELIRGYTKNAPISNEPRGNKHFIYSTRVHLGLYHFLMKLGAEVSTEESKRVVEEIVG
ncbi:MAG: AarF/ABC1/UbiB kinase family protein [Balneolaceae bacterium]|nr:AarF/ABC1/UbiB kinase family protein [Balneolaceae bacterium]MCH8550207.1 AarF/ABC1/UbiB kinase family protein [Balneolaceae bacterium]